METITLAEAATRLGISTKTARRWVKVGRLTAMLEPGEHGPEYRVGVEALTAAQVVDSPGTPVAGVVTAEQAKLLRALDTLPTLLATLEAMATEMREARAEMRAEIAELRQIVVAMAPQPPAETHTIETHIDPPRRPWWHRAWRRVVGR